jgi:hypothetical protein
MENQTDARAELEDRTLEANARTPPQRIRMNIARAALITGSGVAALVGTAAPAVAAPVYLAGAPVYLSQPF